MRTQSYHSLFFLPLCLILFLSACGGAASSEEKTKSEFGIRPLNTASPDSDQYVLVETNRGNIKLKLYRDTPLHRKNFINLVMNGFYDGQLFFRVKPNFMIQAGDPKSRNAKKGELLGETEVSYKIPSEINPSRHWHKYGALSAASLNPAVESSGSQFYIITGQKLDGKYLDKQEIKYNKTLRRKVFEQLQKPYQSRIDSLNALAQKDARKKKELYEMIHFFSEKTDSVMEGQSFAYSPEQRMGYKQQGGAYHLDGYFTVFGEVIEGMDIVDDITHAKRDVRDRPVEDVVILKMRVVEE